MTARESDNVDILVTIRLKVDGGLREEALKRITEFAGNLATDPRGAEYDLGVSGVACTARVSDEASERILWVELK